MRGCKKLLEGEGIRARVVSMPSWEIFDEQSAEYKQSVLPDGVPKIAVEAGSPLGWWKYVGKDGDVIGLDRYGASAPGPVVLEKLGFTGPNVATRRRSSQGQGRGRDQGKGPREHKPVQRKSCSLVPSFPAFARSSMKLVISADHAGFSLKEEVRAYLTKAWAMRSSTSARNNLGSPDDYPDFAGKWDRHQQRRRHA